jgi:hypothetical protein
LGGLGDKDGKHYDRLEAQNRRDLEVGLKAKLEAAKAKEAAEIEANGFFTEPEWREVISPDGVKCHVTRFRDPAPPLSNDLSIPACLRRRCLH